MYRRELEPLTTKPLLPVENGPGGIDCALEMELSSLAPEDAAEFRSGPSALDDVVHRLKEALGLITFFTIGDAEARSWTFAPRRDRARCRGVDSLGHCARVHSLRGDPLG